MADLTLAGISVRVLRNTWVEHASVYQGGRGYSRANNILSTEDEATRRRVAHCTVDFPTYTDELDARAACPKGIAVAIAGDLPSTGFNALVDIGEVTAIFNIVAGIQVLIRSAVVTITQASA